MHIESDAYSYIVSDPCLLYIMACFFSAPSMSVVGPLEKTILGNPGSTTHMK